MQKKQKTILLGITGSIAAYRMCDLILDLKEEGIDVIPVLTKDGQHFITPLTVQSLAAHEVYTDFFSLEGRTQPVHISLAQKADLIVVSPASADFLARMRMGRAEGILTATLLAAQSPVVVVPAMNDRMLQHPATQENLKVLQERGVHVIPPVKGKLVCSDVAMGHIAPNDVILQTILDLLRK